MNKKQLREDLMDAAATELLLMDSSEDDEALEVIDDLEENLSIISFLRYSYQSNIPKKRQRRDREVVETFARFLNSTPKVKPKSKINSRSVIDVIYKQKMQISEAKNKIEEKKIERETKLKKKDLKLAREKFVFEQEYKLKKIEQKNYDRELKRELKLKEIESKERIEKMRIEMEFKYKLELAKLNKNDQ